MKCLVSMVRDCEFYSSNDSEMVHHLLDDHAPNELARGLVLYFKFQVHMMDFSNKMLQRIFTSSLSPRPEVP